ncbi:class I SAM-dependent methyltransferase [Algicola sagamiensis]|uniref:class I SAM-dependent methyltransferase n=1 Tax=Algicola sagamiensis TaxID=163869 RepID=UPI00036500A6|nr:class I SAM-dependent methyltransferase [Algicola sagamiensis]
MSTQFPDHFSLSADLYAEFRPTYPDVLFKYIVSICPDNRCVWDCATGNGQAAISLSKYFQHVIATDASQEQIEQAMPYTNIDFRVASAEYSGLPSQSMDCITVAQALHWFNFQEFFQEVRRVLKPSGILACWCYEHCQINDAIDEIILDLYANRLKCYWPEERHHVEQHYQTISFPFEQIAVPEFVLEKQWSLKAFVGYLTSWSATQRFIAHQGYNPVGKIYPSLAKSWKEQLTVRWPLTLIICKMPD